MSLLESIHSLSLSLSKGEVPTGSESNHVPFTETNVCFTNHFLPIIGPVHFHYLTSLSGIIWEDLKAIGAFTRKELTTPMFHTSTSKDLRDSSGDELIRGAF